MPFKKNPNDLVDRSRQVHLTSSVISINNKKRYRSNSDAIDLNYRSSFTKCKEEQLYNGEMERQYRSSYKNTKIDSNHISYRDTGESEYNKIKRSRISIESDENNIKKCDRSSHKNKDQSNKRENRKHKKTRDHKDKSKRDKYQSKSKKDHKRRKSINEDDPESKCANEPFEYNNDYINNDSDVNEDTLHKNFSSLEPIVLLDNKSRHSVSNDADMNLHEFWESEMMVKEKELVQNILEIDDDYDHQNKLHFTDEEEEEEEFGNSDHYDEENYHHYPTRSKFESISSDESDLGDDHAMTSYERDSQSVSSRSSSSESFGSSISSSRNPKKRHKKSKSPKNSTQHDEDEDKLIFSPVKDQESEEEEIDSRPLYFPAVQGCRLVEEFECLNKIEEGTYGVVFRARDRKTNEIVALKRLKMEKERDGFPITSLREINTLMKAQHENIVTVREVVVGSNMDKIYLVMDFIEHDLKSLMISMPKPFEICEVKCLMLQLLSAVAHLHDNWILHRDLKTSNLLLSHKGVLKVADFGLAREYGSPLKNYTRVVVTLWYRAPELLLGTKVYSTQIDLWSVGCIFGELLLMVPLFPGKSEADQINILFKELGTPSEKIWPGVSNLPNIKRFEFGKFEYNRLAKKFNMTLSESGLELINRFLAYCPDRRITAEEALNHSYFNESPKAISSEMFPTRPAKSEGGVFLRSRLISSPKPPSGGQVANRLNDDKILGLENLYNRR